MARKIATFIRKNTTLIVLLFVAVIFFNQYYAYVSSSAAIREGLVGQSGGGHAEIIYFAMKTCGHCKKFDPEWKKFVEKTKSDGLPVTPVKINADTTQSGEKAKLKAHKVKGFPTVILVTGNEGIPYDGARTADGLVNFCKQNLQ